MTGWCGHLRLRRWQDLKSWRSTTARWRLGHRARESLAVDHWGPEPRCPPGHWGQTSTVRSLSRMAGAEGPWVTVGIWMWVPSYQIITPSEEPKKSPGQNLQCAFEEVFQPIHSSPSQMRSVKKIKREALKWDSQWRRTVSRILSFCWLRWMELLCFFLF